MKKAKLSSAITLSFIGTIYLCHDHGIRSQTHHIVFEKHEKCSTKKGVSKMELSSRFLGISTYLSREQEK
jgi:hypothetical protein